MRFPLWAATVALASTALAVSSPAQAAGPELTCESDVTLGQYVACTVLGATGEEVAWSVRDDSSGLETSAGATPVLDGRSVSPSEVRAPAVRFSVLAQVNGLALTFSDSARLPEASLAGPVVLPLGSAGEFVLSLPPGLYSQDVQATLSDGSSSLEATTTDAGRTVVFSYTPTRLGVLSLRAQVDDSWDVSASLSVRVVPASGLVLAGPTSLAAGEEGTWTVSAQAFAPGDLTVLSSGRVVDTVAVDSSDTSATFSLTPSRAGSFSLSVRGPSGQVSNTLSVVVSPPSSLDLDKATLSRAAARVLAAYNSLLALKSSLADASLSEEQAREGSVLAAAAVDALTDASAAHTTVVSHVSELSSAQGDELLTWAEGVLAAARADGERTARLWEQMQGVSAGPVMDFESSPAFDDALADVSSDLDSDYELVDGVGEKVSARLVLSFAPGSAKVRTSYTSPAARKVLSAALRSLKDSKPATLVAVQGYAPKDGSLDDRRARAALAWLSKGLRKAGGLSTPGVKTLLADVPAQGVGALSDAVHAVSKVKGAGAEVVVYTRK